MRARLMSLLTAAVLALSFVGLNMASAQGADTATITGKVTPAGLSNLQVMVEMLPDGTPTGATAKWASVNDDGSYSVDVTPGSTVMIRAKADGYLYTWLGGFATASASYVVRDLLSSPDVTKIIAPAAGRAQSVPDITLDQGAVISGTVTPTGAGNAKASVYELTADGQLPFYPQTVSVGSDGSYTVTVTPGATVAIRAQADGYFYTWLGDYVQTNSTTLTSLPSTGIATITAPAAGQTQSLQSINLAKASSISGRVTVPRDYSIDAGSVNRVSAYEVTTSDGITTIDTTSHTGAINANDGTYVINNLEPGKQYIVMVNTGQLASTPSAGFMTTVFGGYVSLDPMTTWDLNDPSIRLVPTTEDVADGIDIVMKTAPTISGTITPADASSKSVQVCEVTSTASSQSISDNCVSGTVNSDGVYTAPVKPGSTVVIQAYAYGSGYLYTWFGGYATNDSRVPGSVLDRMTPVPIPTDGSSVSGKNIELAQPASMSGTLTLPGGYEFSSENTYVQGGSITIQEVIDGVDGPTLGTQNQTVIYSVDGSYKFSRLVPGRTYIVYATPSGLRLSAGQASDLVTTAYGGFISTSYPKDIDLADPLLVQITAEGDKTDVNIRMVARATIAGTVYLPGDGGPASSGTVYCYEAGTLSNPIRASVNSDGTYACGVLPGHRYSVMARVGSYAETWAGGYIGADPDANDPKVTVIPALSPGDTHSGEDITLANSSTIYGTLTYSPDPVNPSPRVTACPLQGDIIDMSNCVYTNSINSNGYFVIRGVTPDTPYVVFGSATGYVTTWYGGFVGSDPTMPNDQVMTVPPLRAGYSSDVNITLVKPATITGTVSPQSVMSDTSVYACPAYRDNGEEYYKNYTLSCVSAQVDPDSGTYSVSVVPGVDYVVVGVSPDHVDAWYGGYLGDAGISSSEQADQLVPSTRVMTVSGEQGETKDSIDIRFGESLVTFNAEGGTTETESAWTGVDGKIATLPTPAKTDYRFDGWFTQPDGEGEQFTVDTVVTDDTTVYAKWTELFSVIYDPNDGTGATVDPTSYASGDKATIRASQFTRDGYTFSKWTTDVDGSGQSYKPGDQVTMTKELILFAQWEPKTTPTPSSSPKTSLPGSTVTTTTPASPSTSTGMASSAPVSPSVSVTLGNTAAPSGSSTSSSMTSSAPVSPGSTATTTKPANPSGSTTTTVPVNPSGSTTTTAPVNPSSSVPTSKPANPSGSATTAVPVNTTGSATSTQPVTSNGQTSGGATSASSTTGTPGGSVTTTTPGTPAASTQSAAPSVSVTTSAPAATKSTVPGQPSASGQPTQPSGTAPSESTASSQPSASNGSQTPGQPATTTAAPGQPSASVTTALPNPPSLPGVSTSATQASSAPATSAAPGTSATSSTPGAVATSGTPAGTSTPGSSETSAAPTTSATPGTPTGSETSTVPQEPGTPSDITQTVTVTFDANGGSGDVPSSDSYAVGSTVTLPDSVLTQDGYTFSGWNTAADGTGVTFAPGADMTILGNGTTANDLILYAVWTPIGTEPTSPNTPSASETPGTPGSSETPGVPGASETPGTPTASETPGTPSGSTTPGTPGSSETPSTPGGSATPSAPGASATPATPGTVVTPGAPAESTAPGTPASTETPSAPTGTETPSAPAASETPGTPTASEAPGAPGAVSTPGAPGSSETPGAPGTTAVPGTPSGSETPAAPQGPSTPSVTTGTGTVTYNSNGGSGSIPNSGPHSVGDTVTLPAASFTREGYTFTGWNTAADGTGTAFAPGAQLTITGNGTAPGDLTLYAQWTKTTSQPAASVNTNKAGAVSVPSGGTSQGNELLIVVSVGLIAAGVFIRRISTRS